MSDNDNKDWKWYVIQTPPGSENRFLQSLSQRIKMHGMDEYFGTILVPSEEVLEVRCGRRRKSERKFFPGYILIRMCMSPETWHLVKSTPNVKCGFIGGSCPAPIPDEQARKIIEKLEQRGNKPRPKTEFKPGQAVRIHSGPFADFCGSVESVDYAKNFLVVGVSVFGRPTPVELDFSQVEKE